MGSIQFPELMGWSNSGISYLKKKLELINFKLKFATKRKLNPQINLPFKFRNISSMTSTYSEYLRQSLNGTGIDKFWNGIDKFDVELE